jgi:hypothetical protein
MAFTSSARAGHRRAHRGTRRIALLAAATFVVAGVAGAGEPPAPWGPTPPERVTRGHDAWLSPSGTWLAFQRVERDLRTRDLKGQPVSQNVLHLREVATGVERKAEVNGGVTGWIGDDVVVFGDGSTLRIGNDAGGPVLTTSPKGIYTPGWARSRDGRQVAYTVRGFTLEDSTGTPPEGREHTIHVVRAGEAPRALDLGEVVDMRNAYGLLAFSPNGRHLAFHVGFMHLGQLPHPRAGVVDLETGTTTFVLDETADARSQADARFEKGVAAWGAWDPAGRRFVVVGAGDGTRRDLHVATADGAEVRRLTVDGEWKGGPCLSPDGDRCAYWVDAPGTESSSTDPWAAFLGSHHGTGLRVLHLRSGETMDLPVPSGGTGADLQWAPDGTHLWFAWSGGDAYGIYRVSAPPSAVVPDGTPIIDRKLTPVDEVLERLRSPDAHTVERGLSESESLDDPRVTQAILDVFARAVRSGTYYRPWEILREIEGRGAVTAVPLLLESLSRRRFVQAVTMTLLRWDVAEAVPFWRALLDAGDEARAAAYVALARFGGEEAWERLRAEMATGKRDFRDMAVQTLAAVRDPRSVDMLIPLTADKTFLYTSEREYVLGDHAAGSLHRLTGRRLGKDPQAWATWWESVDRVLPAREEAGPR